MDETSAQIKIDALNAIPTAKWFCPLIKTDCNTKCICYQPAGKFTHNLDWRVTPGYCNNAMFSDE